MNQPESVSFGANSSRDLAFLEAKRLGAGIDPSTLQIGEGRHHSGRSYAELIALHNITNFTFSYERGCFTAVNAVGDELATAETIRDLLDSL